MTIREPLFYLNIIAQTIFDKKGFNILVLDVRGVSSLTDYIIIAEATFKQLKERGLLPVRTEGMKEGDWVVMDYFHIMIHLFMPGLRDKYQLEQLWKEGQIVDVHIDVNLKNNLNPAHTLKN
jgi:ribosome-associated protein